MITPRPLSEEFFIPANSIMVDIETCGPDPEKSIMIQLGACEFLPDFTTGREFCMSLDNAPGRTCDDATLKWWKDEDQNQFDKINSVARPYDIVLDSFRQWLPEGDLPVFWGWPLSFDLMFLFQYARQYNRPLLHFVHPSRFIDCRSWALGARGNLVTHDQWKAILAQPVPKDITPGPVHDGLQDAKTQVWQLGVLSTLVRMRQADLLLPPSPAAAFDKP